MAGLHPTQIFDSPKLWTEILGEYLLILRSRYTLLGDSPMLESLMKSVSSFGIASCKLVHPRYWAPLS